MLPSTLLDRIVATGAVRTWERSEERRQSQRVPIRKSVEVYPLRDGAIDKPTRGWLKDVSATGAALVTNATQADLSLLLIRIAGVNVGGSASRASDISLLLKVVRWAKRADSAAVVGTTFQRLLLPGQDIVVGKRAAEYLWLDVASETPIDPFKVLEVA